MNYKINSAVPFLDLVSDNCKNNESHNCYHHQHRNQSHHPGQEFTVRLVLRTGTAIVVDFIVADQGCHTGITKTFIYFLTTVFPLISSFTLTSIVGIKAVRSVGVMARVDTRGC